MRCIQRRRRISKNVIRNKKKHFNFPINLTKVINFHLIAKSLTVGYTEAFDDGATRIPLLTINSSNPILEACRAILKATSRSAATYKLAVYQNGVLLLTVRSILFGSKRTIDEDNPDFILLDYPAFTDILG